MLVRLDLRYRFLLPGFWWMHAMAAAFAAALFGAEPLVLHRWLLASGQGQARGELRAARAAALAAPRPRRDHDSRRGLPAATVFASSSDSPARQGSRRLPSPSL
jgi:hypothetical protein